MKRKRFNFNIAFFDETGLEAHTIKSLKLIIFGIAFGTVFFNITGGVAMTGYLESLGTSNFTFGLLYAIGPAAAPMQLVASYILERTRKRKMLFITFGIIQRMSWLPFGLVPLFVPMEPPALRIWTAAFFLVVSAVTNPFVNVSFFSLAADLIPMDIRGSYLAVRSRIATMFGVAGGLLTAWFLDSFTGADYRYAFVFTLAAIMGTLDILCFTGVKFPPMAASEKREKFSGMIKQVVKNKRYMKFVIFMTCYWFSVSLSLPFYLRYQFEIIGFSNTFITFIVQIIPSICSIIMVKRWGRAIDAHGCRAVMRLSCGITSVTSFLWIILPGKNSAPAIIMVIAVYTISGCIYAGFDIGQTNIMMSYAPKENRSLYIAVFFMTTSLIGIGGGNAAGGWLLDNVFALLETEGGRMTKYNYIFALTAILRFITVYIALPRLIRDENGATVRGLLRSAGESLRITAQRMKLRLGIGNGKRK
jgi:MFS family permease